MKLFSVIIPAKNEEDNIERCIRAVQKQVLKPLECIVVDNGSDDNTVKIAKKNNAKVLHLPFKNIGELRNFGAKESKGEYLAFLDADCEPDEHWLFFAEKNFTSDVGAVGNTVLPSDVSCWVEDVWYFNIKKNGGDVNYIGSANLIVKREIFDHIGGFDPNLNSGEDRDLSRKIQRLGYRTIHDNKLKVIHHGYPKNLKEFFKREKWHGKSIIVDYSDIFRSKMFHILSLISLLLVFLMGSILLNNNYYVLTCAFLLFSFPFGISFCRCLKNRRFNNFFHLALLYFIYFSARLISFYEFLFKLFKIKSHNFIKGIKNL